MRSEDCCIKWAQDCANFYVYDDIEKIKNIKYDATNVHAKGNKLYSWSTPICIFRNGQFIFSVRKYSMSTSKHQSYMRGAVIDISSRHNLICRSVYDINENNWENY